MDPLRLTRKQNTTILQIEAVFLAFVGLLPSCTEVVDSSESKDKTEQSDASKKQESEDPSPDLGATTSAKEATEPGGTSDQPNGSNSDLPDPGSPSDDTSAIPTTGPSNTGSGPEEQPEVDCQSGQTRTCGQDDAGKEIVFPGGIPKGSCKLGEQQCVEGAWGKCEGAVGPKPKDTCEPGNDDNCNGIATDHCSCQAGATERCGSSVGECKEGTRTCSPQGQWGECTGQLEPTKEICGGGKDEDCDGQADLDDQECDCLVDSGDQKCTLPGEGDCALGQRSCMNGKWSSCRPRFKRTNLERCGAQSDKFGPGSGDENCDGRIDEFTPREPIGCRFYMVDEDRDGQGAVGRSANSSGIRNATYGCFCNRPNGVGWTLASNRRDANRDCGDCDADVFVGQRGYFEQPSACLRKVRWDGGQYDYDCSRSQDVEHRGKIVCEFVGSECKRVRGYWSNTGGIPNCGENGYKGGCTENGPDVCTFLSLEDDVQACR